MTLVTIWNLQTTPMESFPGPPPLKIGDFGDQSDPLRILSCKAY